MQFFILSISYVVAFASPIIYNQQYDQPNYLPGRSGFLTPPKAITTLNTFIPRQLIPSAPPRSSRIIRVYENNQPSARIYTVPPTFRTIAPAPTTRRPQPFIGNTNNNPRYAFNYGVNDNRVNRCNYLPSTIYSLAVTPSFHCALRCNRNLSRFFRLDSQIF